MPKLPIDTNLKPLDEAIQMVMECIHGVVECYEAEHNRITFTRKGVDFTAYIWPVDKPSCAAGDCLFQGGRAEDGYDPTALKIKGDGTFWIGDREIEGEEFRDEFAKFAKMMCESWQRDIARVENAVNQAAVLGKQVAEQATLIADLRAHLDEAERLMETKP